MTERDRLTVTTPSEREIVLRREFDAPRRLVFAAWTTPELLMRWYGARGWNLVECDVDLRVGGRWRFVSRGPDGARMGQSGITHVFVEERGRTTVTTTVRYPSRDARDRVLRYPMARGVADGYRRLAAVLADLRRSPREPDYQARSTRGMRS